MHQNPATAPSGLSTRRVGLVLVGISASVMLLDPASAEPAHKVQQVVSAPPFVYRPGPQGFGYYANPSSGSSPVQTAPAARNQPRSVGARHRKLGHGPASRRCTRHGCKREA